MNIIIWSLGNEAGYGPNHDALAGWIHGYDPTRPVHYEGANSQFSALLPIVQPEPVMGDLRILEKSNRRGQLEDRIE